MSSRRKQQRVQRLLRLSYQTSCLRQSSDRWPRTAGQWWARSRGGSRLPWAGCPSTGWPPEHRWKDESVWFAGEKQVCIITKSLLRRFKSFLRRQVGLIRGIFPARNQLSSLEKELRNSSFGRNGFCWCMAFSTALKASTSYSRPTHVPTLYFTQASWRFFNFFSAIPPDSAISVVLCFPCCAV